MPRGLTHAARATAAVLTLAVAGGALAACGGSRSASGPAGPSGAPVAGDTLTIAVSAPPNSLDPGMVANAASTFTMLAYDSLTYLDGTGTVQPGLATSWKYVGDNNTTFELTIRDGLKFADGSALTADAVKNSLDYTRKAGGAQSVALAAVTSVTATGNTVTLTLSAPNPELPQALDQYNGIGSVISPTGLKDPKALTVANASQGIGAYTFDPADSVAGDHYTYSATAGYWNKDRQHFKKMVLRVIANPQSVVNALKTGQVDAVIGGDVSVKSQVEAAGARALAYPFVFQGLALLDRSGTVSKPLGDLRVRQAINYALDRTTISKAVLGADGVPTTQTVLKGADGYSSAAAEQYSYDVDKAKALLTQAGYPNGFTLPVSSIAFAGIDTMAQAIKGELAKVGITVELKTATDLQSYIGDLTGGQYPAAAVGYGAQSVFAEGQGLFLPTAPVFNGFKTDDEKLVALYDQAAAAAPDQRTQLDQQIVEYLVDQAWFAPVAFAPVVYYSSADIGGITLSAGNPVPSPLDWYTTK